MERRNFLRRLFNVGVAAAALATVPAMAKTDKKETFKIEDLFDKCSGNGQLYYLKPDTWLEQEIRDILGNRFVDKQYFSCYYPLHNCYLPIKEEYTKEDFENFFITVKSKKYDYFCDQVGNHGTQYGAMRLFKDNDGYYRTELYQARNPKNPSYYY